MAEIFQNFIEIMSVIIDVMSVIIYEIIKRTTTLPYNEILNYETQFQS